MKKYIPHLLGVLFVLLIIGGWVFVSQLAQNNSPSAPSPQQPIVWELWPEGAPTDAEIQEPEEDLGWGTRLVQHPTLTIYPAQHPNGKLVLDCPGGGYWVVCHKHEGSDMAEWFNSQGITLAVLRYRMPNEHHYIPLEDGQRAMQLLRNHSKELKIKEIGVMGFSAGGHLASTLATHFSNPANRPDFQILVYPVISMDTAITHMGSREALIGNEPSEDLVQLYSNELQVTEQTPKAFIVLSGNDDLVPIENSLRYYQALQEHNVEAVLHMYPTDGHGWGFNPTPFHHLWISQLEQWLKD